MVEKGETGRGRESESHGSKSGGWGEDQSVRTIPHALRQWWPEIVYFLLLLLLLLECCCNESLETVACIVLPSESFCLARPCDPVQRIACRIKSDSINSHRTCHIRNNTESPFYRVPEHSNFIARKAYIRHIIT